MNISEIGVHNLIGAMVKRTFDDMFIMDKKGVRSYRPGATEKIILYSDCEKFLQSELLKFYNIDFIKLYEQYRLLKLQEHPQNISDI